MNHIDLSTSHGLVKELLGDLSADFWRSSPDSSQYTTHSVTSRSFLVHVEELMGQGASHVWKLGHGLDHILQLDAGQIV